MPPIPTSAVVVCVSANTVLLFIQLVRSWRAIWRWLVRITRSYWILCDPWDLWSDLDTWPLWSIIQAICYLVAVLVTLILWRIPSISHNAVLCLLEACYLNSISGQSLILHKVFGYTEFGNSVYLSFVLAVLLHIVGVGLMLGSKDRVGSTFVLASTIASSLIAGIATYSAYYLKKRTWRGTVFMAVFVIGSLFDIVLGAIFLSSGITLILALGAVRGCVFLVLTIFAVPKPWLEYLRRKMGLIHDNKVASTVTQHSTKGPSQSNDNLVPKSFMDA